MALNMSKHGFFMLLTSLLLAAVVEAGDPDLLSDFAFMSTNQTAVPDATFFTFTGLRGLADSAPPAAFKVTKASTIEFPALLGLGVSYALLQYPVGSINPLHTHPRGTELLYVLEGSLKVGLIDTKDVLYVQRLKKGDRFVFPMGLVHFQVNTGSKSPSVALSAFSSANAGTVSLPGTLFATGIDNSVLAMSFKADVKTIQKIKAGLVTKG